MTDDTIRKKRGRSKVFTTCFRPSTDDDRPSSSQNSDDLNSKSGRLGKPVFIAVGGRKGKGSNSVNDDVSGSGDDCYDKRSSSSSSSRRRFSRILKAVFFEKAMSKRIRKSSSKSSIASNTSVSSLSSDKTGKSFNESNQYGKEYTDFDDSASRRSYISSSRTASSAVSTSSSSVNSSSRVDCEVRHPVSSKWLSSTKPNHIRFNRSCLDQKGASQADSHSRNPASSNLPPNPEKIKSGRNNLNIRLCLFLLLSLFVLVFWGRIFSILCTSIWFYFVPCRRIKRVDSVTDAVEFLDTYSEQYKKKVIMAGLLERSRPSFR